MDDHHAILALLQRYFAGVYHGDITALRDVFDPRAQLFGEVRGQPYHKTLEDYLSLVAGRRSPASLGERLRMRVLSLDVEGPVANARTHSPMLGYNYHDWLALSRASGCWLIVNKLFTHVDPVA